MRPFAIPEDIQRLYNLNYNDPDVLQEVRLAYQKLHSDTPLASVVMPAYNEEANIVQSLASLCANVINFPLEIIVVNNNSADRTEELVKACGITCITEKKQGISHARDAGMAHARGKFILNADADTIYPKGWMQEMITPLQSSSIAITYSLFSFIPTGKTGRKTYFFYEYLADLSRMFNRVNKDEAVNVYGFSSAYKKEHGLAVGGFAHPPGTSEDGWFALQVKKKKLGKLYLVKSRAALVWTTDRRVQIDGGLFPGFVKRVKRIITRR